MRIRSRRITEFLIKLLIKTRLLKYLNLSVMLKLGRKSVKLPRADEVTQFLSSLNYKMFQLHHEGRIVRLDRTQTHGNLELSDYLFMPEESTGLLT